MKKIKILLFLSSISIHIDAQVFSTPSAGVANNGTSDEVRVNGYTKLINPNGRTLMIERDDEDSWLTFHDPGQYWYSMGIDRSNSGSFTLNPGGALGGNYFVMNNSGNVGIGTNNPLSERLEVSGKFKISTNGSDYGLLYHTSLQEETGYNNVWPDQYERALMFKANAYLDGYGAGGGGFQFWTYDKDEGGSWGSYTGSLKRAMVIRRNGNVGIGTALPDAALTVKGDIHTREVRVDMNGAVGPDYVFEEDYKLPSLTEVEAYLKQHKHLSEVPSAKEMEENGINLKEMNLILLKKVEELTLYILQQEKRIKNLEDSQEQK